MSALSTRLSKFQGDESGVTGVEVALLTGVFVMVVGGGMELGLTYWRANALDQAARIGARLAATHDPVATELSSKTWLDSGRRAGEALPDYTYSCSGKTQSCTVGGYDAAALDVILRGPDRTGCDTDTTRAEQGVCDFAPGIGRENIRVTYTGSGMGTAGDPANPKPLISVTLTGVQHDFLFLERLFPGGRTLPDITVTVMAEDMRGAS